MNNNLYPTGKCFDDGIEIIEMFLNDPPFEVKKDTLILVHAICEPEFFEKHAHCWVELPDLGVALFRAKLGSPNAKPEEFSGTIDEYHEHYNPTYIKRYNLQEVHEMNVKYGTYGPWEKVLLDLCKDKVR
jgi:hypothetical protein